jgi:hypothetical protein
MNHHLYSFGLGAYHSGIEVCGAEFTFGSHDGDSSAVVAIEPRTAPGCAFRESIALGSTRMSLGEIRALANRMGEETFFGTAYTPKPPTSPLLSPPPPPLPTSQP